MNKLRGFCTERRVTYVIVLLTAIILLIIPGLQDRFVRACFAVPLFVFSFLFTVSYGWKSDWKSSQVGKSLLYWTGCVSLLSLYISVALLTKGDYLYSNEIGTLIYAGLAATVYLMYRQWYKINAGQMIVGSSNDPHRPEPKLSRNQMCCHCEHCSCDCHTRHEDCSPSKYSEGLPGE